MIREILKPNSDSFTISIPDEYINQEIEFIMFPIQQKQITKTQKQMEEIKMQFMVLLLQ